MGEPKRRNITKAKVHPQIDDQLKQLGIDTTRFGFFDQPPFQEMETRDPQFLEQYALWVQSRPRTDEYDKRVRELIPR